MNKKSIKIISAILMAMILIFSISSMVFAIDPSTLTGDTSVSSTQISQFGNQIIGILKIVGSVVAVVMLMVLGFKYMMGSAEDKADYKKSMIPYLVGAVLIFLAPMIAGAVYDFLQ